MIVVDQTKVAPVRRYEMNRVKDGTGTIDYLGSIFSANQNGCGRNLVFCVRRDFENLSV
jgi:hypothetical protein